MDSDSCKPLRNPKRLKTLVANVRYSKGNTLLHQFVLDNCDPNYSGSENYLNAVLLSMSDTSVNALNDDGYSALHLAVLKNNLLMVKKLLSCLVHIDINKRCDINDENPPLHLATKLGHVSIIQELLNKGATIDTKNRYGDTALCFAVESGDLDIIKLLVSKSANVNLIGRCGYPLHYAAESGNLATVEFLLGNGADINAKDKYGWTPLCYAVESGNSATAGCLVNSGADVNAENVFIALCNAAISGHLDIIKFLLDNGVQVDFQNESGCEVLLCAARSGCLETIAFLIDKGADVNARDEYGSTPLHEVMQSKNLATVEFLLGNGADLNAKDENNKTPLHYAARLSSLEIVEFLVGKGSNLHAIDICGKTPLHEALYRKNLKIAAFLVDQGADLHVKLVLESEIDRNARYKNGDTTLHLACDGDNYLDIIEMLLRKGSDVNAKNELNETPLHAAVRSNHLDYVQLLLERGSSVNVADINGCTPLHAAVHIGCVEIIKALLDKGADVNAKDKDGKTPLDLAKEEKHRLCIDALQNVRCSSQDLI